MVLLLKILTARAIDSSSLSTSINADDGETFMDQDSPVGCMVATPVWSAVSNLSTHPNRGGLELLHIGMAVAWLGTFS